MTISTTEEIINEAANGRMVILVDDEARENEGDLVLPAQMVSPDTINFMAKHARGLICLALEENRAKQLKLGLMVEQPDSRLGTAFTVSIEARDGVTTGISAHDRAQTIRQAIDPTKSASDLRSPGHVFPLIARKGGVLVRAGHTEAAVDLARLAGLTPAGVICEIMRDDGTMARLPDLLEFADRHDIKIGTIADLIAYRSQRDSIVEEVGRTAVTTAHAGDFQGHIFANTAEYTEHLVLVKGDVSGDGPVLVRIHVANVFEDIVGEAGDRLGLLSAAMRMIDDAGRGVVIILRDSNPTGLSELSSRREGLDTPGSPRLGLGRTASFKEYGVGAQILMKLGVHKVIILTNTKYDLAAIPIRDLQIAGRLAISTAPSPAH
jgi:3,4-dihydroxy 2-butanone 4-phosphate synthase/GTP cyclohydrolase II